MVSKKVIKDIIDKEIKWSENTDNQMANNITEEEANWFVKGLKQAKLLVDSMND